MGPELEDDLAGVHLTGKEDVNFAIWIGKTTLPSRMHSCFGCPYLRALPESRVRGIVPFRSALQKGRRRDCSRGPGKMPRMALLRLRLPL